MKEFEKEKNIDLDQTMKEDRSDPEFKNKKIDGKYFRLNCNKIKLNLKFLI